MALGNYGPPAPCGHASGLPGSVCARCRWAFMMTAMETRGAEVSADGVYRYKLWRIWDTGRPLALFVMLNPSTADANQDDPTIRRCIGFAKSWGYGGILVGNLFAIRATDPKDMRCAADPIGPRNDEALGELHGQAGITIAAWGVHGIYCRRATEVVRWWPGRVYCLGSTKDGHPKHPLYLPKDAEIVPYGSASL